MKTGNTGFQPAKPTHQSGAQNVRQPQRLKDWLPIP
jgi:hypothetical protein